VAGFTGMGGRFQTESVAALDQNTQSYIHYRKGTVIMYALQDYIGEEVVNRALWRYVKNHSYKSAPYPVSTDLIGYLKDEAGPTHDALIEGFFEKITMFDLKFAQSTVTKLTDGRLRWASKSIHRC
jgi:aminopeptidase N